MDVTLASISTLQSLLRSRSLSSAELLEAILQRIDAINPTLNAVVAMDRMAARQAAAEADLRLANGTVRPLEGLPVTIKDAFDVAGIVSTAGAPAFKDRLPEEDASAVARLRGAGAIIIGKTNVPVFSGDFQAYNAVYGTTSNPWDQTRSPGGSSGGAAAAVATGMSVFELGSDLGGSIRWPAHAVGIFGLKPTWSLVSTFGHVPPLPEYKRLANTDLVVAGPLARSAGDLDLLLPILAGPADPTQPATPLAPPRTTDPAKLRVAVWLDEPFAPVDAPVRAAVIEAAEKLGAAGARIDLEARPSFRFEEGFEGYALLNHAIVSAGLPQAVRDKIAARSAEFLPEDRSHPALQARGAHLSADRYQAILATRRKLKAAWADFFTRYDVVLCPPAPVAAILHDHGRDVHGRRLIVNGEERPYLDLLMWASLATFSHLPAAVAPVRIAAGLPSGVQIIGPEFEDRSVIAVARMLEDLGCTSQMPTILSHLQK